MSCMDEVFGKDNVYDEILTLNDGTTSLDADAAAAALRTAILTLLAESPGIPPQHWAAYIHTGPSTPEPNATL